MYSFLSHSSGVIITFIKFSAHLDY
jgi:hypothetical protein